jgi:glutathione S-transferase
VAQPVRHLLYFLDVPFEDVFHERTRENDVEVGFNMGFPLLEDGATRVHEAVAIMVYLCRKFERVTLLGLTPQSTVLALICRLAFRKSSSSFASSASVSWLSSSKPSPLSPARSTDRHGRPSWRRSCGR